MRPLVPREYKFRQKVLDTMFRIAKANPRPTCHHDEIASALNERQEKIEAMILYLVRNDYAKHVGSQGEPLYGLTPKGMSASIDWEFLRTGRDERHKNVLAYGAWLGFISITITIVQALYTIPKVVRLERKIESMEQGTPQQSRSIPEETAVHSNQNPSTQLQVYVDTFSSPRDSAMLRAAVDIKPKP